MNEIITLLPLITVFIIFYVILYIPQRRRQKKHKEYVMKSAMITSLRELEKVD